MAHDQPDPFLKLIGDSIVNARKAQNMSQLELSERSNIHRVRLSRIENGEQNFTMDTLRRICTALAMPPSELLLAIDISILLLNSRI